MQNFYQFLDPHSDIKDSFKIPHQLPPMQRASFAIKFLAKYSGTDPEGGGDLSIAPQPQFFPSFRIQLFHDLRVRRPGLINVFF